MLVKTQEAFYEIQETDRGFLVTRTYCAPKGVENDLPEKASFEGNLLVFNTRKQMVLFNDQNERVLKTAPIEFPKAISAPQV